MSEFDIGSIQLLNLDVELLKGQLENGGRSYGQLTGLISTMNGSAYKILPWIQTDLIVAVLMPQNAIAWQVMVQLIETSWLSAM